MISFEQHATLSQDAPQTFPEQMAELDQQLRGTSAQIFEAMLPRVVERIVGPGEPTREALANGGFVLNDCTVVVRLDAETDSVEFFCDVGLPQLHSEENVYRTALEFNLCRTYPGIIFGVHPESGRLVATASTHALLVGDDDVCINTLQMLTGVVSQLRADRAFDVEV